MGGKGDRDTEENRRIYRRQAGETGGDRASIPGPTCPLLSPPLSHLNAGFPFVSPLTPLQEERVGIETENPKGMRGHLTRSGQAASLIGSRLPLSCFGHTAVNR